MERNLYSLLKKCFFIGILFSVSFLSKAQIQITTEEGLRNMANDLSADYILMNDITLASDWTPIGDRTNPFEGNFDGNGHVIRNLRIVNAEGNQIGFFGAALKSAITKLGFENAYIDGGTPTSYGNDVGVIVGEGTGVTLSECYTSDFVVYGRDHVAGIMGGTKIVGDGATRSVISDCYAIGTVISRGYQAGGILGTAEDTDITSCYFAGTVQTPNSNTGGILSLAEGDVVNVENCVVMAPFIKGDNCGRVVGKIGKGTLSLNQNYGRVNSKFGKADNFFDLPGTWDENDPNTGPEYTNGANMTLAEATSQEFVNIMYLWDFDDIWKLNDGIYPTLKWQTGKINAHALNIPMEEPNILIGDEYPYIAFGSHGQDIEYGTANNSILAIDSEADGAVTFVTGKSGMKTGTTNVLVSSPATSYMNAVSASFSVKVYDPNDIVTKVYTAEQVYNMRNELFGQYILQNDIDLSEYENFDPIGSQSSPFTGLLDGNGYTISGLKIDRSGSGYQGLFGYARNATIKDLTLKDVRVIGAGDVGALLGKASGVTIEQVAIEGGENCYIEGVDHVGGIAGGIDDGNNSFIRNSYVNAKVHSRASQVGGFLGVAKTIRIENSYFTGTVTSPEGEQGHNTGGIIGLNENGQIAMLNVVSLATSIEGGTCGQFAARGNEFTYFDNIYTRDDMFLSDYATDDHGLGRADGSQVKTVAELRTRAFYESIGWDFNNIWKIEEGVGFPVLKRNPVGIITPETDKAISVYSANGEIRVKAEYPVNVKVYTLTGTVVFDRNIDTETNILLPKGLYIVKAGDKAVKVIN